MPDSPPPTDTSYPDEQREAVYRVIAERRDVRQGFRPDPVPADVLGRVLAAAHQAPSVGLSQPWDFIVITDRARRERIAALARRHRDEYAAGLPGARARAFDRLKIESILDTPVNIVVTCDRTRGGRHTLRPPRPAADRGLLQRAGGGQPVAGRPGRRPRRRLGELLRRARARRRARAARAPGGHRLSLPGLRDRLRARTRAGHGRVGAPPAGVVGGARRGVRPPRTARGGTSGPARRRDRRRSPRRTRRRWPPPANGRTG